MDAMQKFLEYASAYDDGSDTRIKLKIIHTQRVTEVMEQLTAARLLSEQDKKLAYLCAVYHDIGRFEQLKRYHTFLDYKSIDHAQLGCEILRQGDFLGELSDREREQVLTAIGNHNRLAIEDGLDEKTLLFAKLIRDADKCDIFRVFAQEDPVDTTLKERVRLQNSGQFDEIYIMIAGAQALTDNAEHPKKVRQNILQVALDYLACGLDPEKATIFIQSMVPELTELTFYYMNLVTVSRVQRNPTVKAEIQMRNFEASIPVGFFTYPISQAADITAFRATVVPAGEDQMPMVEQCKEIVHKFNSVYGETLTDPQIVLPDNQACLRLPGIDGKAKMSKSLGNCIYLSDEPQDIKKKVMSMFTDPNHLRVEDPGQVEGNPVFIYLDAFCKPEYFEEFWPEYNNLDELKAHYQRGGLGDVKVKKFLNKVLQAELEPIRERRKMWEAKLPEVAEILQKGTKAARAKAQETMKDVRHAMRIDYFNEEGLF